MPNPLNEDVFAHRVERLVVLLTDAQALVKRIRRDQAGLVSLAWIEQSLRELPVTLTEIKKAAPPSPRPTLEKIDTSDETLFARRVPSKPVQAQVRHRTASMPQYQGPPASHLRSVVAHPVSIVSEPQQMPQSRRSSMHSNQGTQAAPSILSVRTDSLPPSISFTSPSPLPQTEPIVGAPVSLNAKGVLRSIAKQLISTGHISTAFSLMLLSRKTHDALQPVLYQSVTIASPSALTKLTNTAHTNRQIAESVRKIVLKSMAGDPRDHLPELNDLLKALPCVSLVDEDWPSGDYDVVTQQDYLALPPLSIHELTSRNAWFEVGALVSILSTQTSSMRSLKIAGAVVDREWQGAHLRQSSSIPLCTALKSLDLEQVMHEDTLVVLLRMCPSLESLKLSLQSVGTTDDDTSRDSLVQALRQVSRTLRHFTLRAPTRPSPEAEGLLDACIPVLPQLETIAFDERSAEGQCTKLCSADTLMRLPPSVRAIEALSIASLTGIDMLKLLSRPDLIPVLDRLHVRWASSEPGCTEDERREILNACRDFGIDARVERA